MYCTRKVTDDIAWVGANDRRLAMFEGVYSVKDGVSYNSYLLNDDKTVLFDTVDKAVSRVFFENLAHELNGRKLDYVVVLHMEPDHSAVLQDLLQLYPEATVLCNAKTDAMIKQFFSIELSPQIVKEGDTIETGRHVLNFVMAPMVHWPEVMVCYDSVGKILFSADAFGTFGALNGALFADEVNFERDYLDEARRYYCNIVGKYGAQVQSLLGKASGLQIEMLCPLHGFVWRKDIGFFVEKYNLWSSYTPEETGVVIAYASVYGNTENTAEVIACKLRETGIKTVMFDVSVIPASEIIAAAFQYSHLIFASTTYNAGIFVSMEELLNDLAAHNIQNRTVAFIENGSWAPSSGKLMREIMGKCKNMNFIEDTITVKSALKPGQLDEIGAFVAKIADTVRPPQTAGAQAVGNIDAASMHKLSYGLFVLTARDGDKDSGCIINTAQQLTDNPKRITISINKNNYTHDMILKTGLFNISVLTQEVTFKTIENFGFASGRDTDKFANFSDAPRSQSGIRYISDGVNAVIGAKVVSTIESGTHTLFVAEVVHASVLSDAPSITYAYYFAHVKPKQQPAAVKKKGFVCKICDYVYEGDVLPDDFICPICKHGAQDFEPIN